MDLVSGLGLPRDLIHLPKNPFLRISHPHLLAAALSSPVYNNFFLCVDRDAFGEKAYKQVSLSLSLMSEAIPFTHLTTVEHLLR